MKFPVAALQGTSTITSKVQVEEGAKFIPSTIILEVPVTEDPIPHILVIGKLVAIIPLSTASRLSWKAISLTDSTGLLLVIVKVRVVELPGVKFPAKDFVKATDSNSNTSDVGLPKTGLVFRVPVKLLVRQLKELPNGASAGVCKVTMNEQEAPAERDTPVKFNNPVPLNMEPAPQILLNGSPVAARPVSRPSKSVEKAIFEIASVGWRLVMVYSTSTVFPGTTGSLRKVLDS